MGFGDRHYNRTDNSYRPAGRAGGGAGDFLRMQFQGAKVTRNLIILNTAIFVLGMILFDWRERQNLFVYWGCFNVNATFPHFQLWRVLSYQFLHATPMHLLFNMLGLFFFGPLVERWLGSRRYMAFYLLCGFGGAIVYTITVLTNWLSDGVMVGASGSLLGILAACAVLAPNMRVLVMGIIPMSMRTMAIVYMAMIGYNLLTRGDNAGGDAAHLGGAVLGLILIKQTWLINWAQRIPIGKPGGELAGPGQSRGGFAANVRQRMTDRAEQKRRDAERRDEAEIDRILAKVKDQGMQSLTAREKATLQRATDNQRRDR